MTHRSRISTSRVGRARALVDLKTENEQKSGKKQKPLEGKATYLLKRIGESERLGNRRSQVRHEPEVAVGGAARMTAAGRSPLHAVDGWRRTAHLGAALLGTTVTRPSAPAKVNFCLTYWCQYRCRTCNIWQRKPADELTTDEVLAFVRENPGITWADLTGGEIFLRPDIETILDAVVQGWRRLALLHFPTNGFLTDRIVSAVERIAGRGPARTIITVSLDGDEALNDSVRGIKGGFRRQIETFRALRRIDGVTTVLGMTLSSYNVGRFAETFDACAREIPGLTADDLHLNVAQVSGHYYDNGGLEGIRPDPDDVRRELRVYRSARACRGRPSTCWSGSTCATSIAS